MNAAAVRREVPGTSDRTQPAHGLPAWWLALPLLLAIALAVRLHGLTHEPLWIDEGYTLMFSRLPLDRLVVVGGSHEHPPLYYLLVHTALHLWHSYLVARLVSALAGALCVPAVALLGAKLFRPVVGIVGALLVALSPFNVWHAQDARGYTLASLFVLLSYLTLINATERTTRLGWLLYVFATALAIYTEYTAALALIPQILYLRRYRRALAFSWIAVGILYIPWIGFFLLNVERIAGGYWMKVPTLQAVAGTFLEVFGLVTPCPTVRMCIPHETVGVAGHEIVIATVLVVLTVVAIVWGSRRSWSVLVLGAWLLVPFALIFALLPVRPLFVDRIFLDATFPLYLLLAAGLVAAARWWRVVAAVSVVLLAVAGGANVRAMNFSLSNPDWRTAAHDIARLYRPGQAVLFYPSVDETLARPYLPVRFHPTRMGGLWVHTYLDVLQHHVPYTLDDNQLRNEQLVAFTAGETQIWLACDDYIGLWDVRHWFETHGWSQVTLRSYEGYADIELWEQNPILSHLDLPQQ